MLPDFVASAVRVVESSGVTDWRCPGVRMSRSAGLPGYRGVRCRRTSLDRQSAGRKSGTYGVRTFRCGPQRPGSAEERVDQRARFRHVGAPA